MGVLALGLGAGLAPAEDADRYRSYFSWRSYEWDTIWGVDDAHGISVGANLDRHWGLELALDSFQHDLHNPMGQRISELTSISLIPEVRYRWPMAQDRLVPYLIGGAGTSFLQANDRKAAAWGMDLKAEGWQWAMAGGAGIEYFIDDNIAFGFEGRYFWIEDLSTRLAGVPGSKDMSSFLLSFGLRMYFDENHVRELADASAERSAATRLYFGVRAGMRTILDGNWGNGIKLTPLAQAYGHVANKHFGIMGGLNLNRNLAVELAADGGETTITVDDKDAIGEYAQVAIMPQLRYRWPMCGGRVVPYVMGGAGLLYAEFNDAKPASAAYPLIEAKGFYPVARGGVGVEYFVARNLSFAFETDYQHTWNQEITLTGKPVTSGDFSSFQALFMFRAYLLDFGAQAKARSME